jgi:hypothetical protein
VASSAPHLRQAVDEVLDAAWPKERLRALVRLAASTTGRVAVFLLALVGLGVGLRVLFGVVVPWTFYIFVGVLAIVCARPGAAETRHLRRRSDEG